MGFLETAVGIIAEKVAEAVVDKITVQLRDVMAYQRIYEKHDKKAKELIDQMRNATSPEEIDALLDALDSNRPDFT